MQGRHCSARRVSLMDRKCVQRFPPVNAKLGYRNRAEGRSIKPYAYAEIILVIIAILGQSQGLRITPSKFSLSALPDVSCFEITNRFQIFGS